MCNTEDIASDKQKISVGMGKSRGGNYRKYTDKQREGALLLLEASTHPTLEGRIAEAAKAAGVNPKTLHHWHRVGLRNGDPVAQEELAELREDMRLELKDMLENVLRLAIGSVPDKIEDADLRDTAMFIGITFDKLRLIDDQPTENIKQAISFERRGISTLPEHLTPRPTPGLEGEAEI